MFKIGDVLRFNTEGRLCHSCPLHGGHVGVKEFVGTVTHIGGREVHFTTPLGTCLTIEAYVEYAYTNNF